MFSNEFMTLIERWIVIPLIGILIAHGFLTPQYPSWIVTVLDQAVAGIFVLVAYILTHKKPVASSPVTPTEQQSIWQKILGYVFVPKTAAAVEETTETTQTLP